MSDWSWKTSDPGQNRELALRYEPGGWGDVLKALWVVHLAQALAERRGRLRLLDPFAGAPDYPLVAGVAQRLDRVRSPLLSGLLAEQPGRLPSAAALALLAAARTAGTDGAGEAGVPLSGRIDECDPERRQAWLERGVEGVPLAKTADGFELLSEHDPLSPDLLLLDPYDLFESWGRLLPLALRRPPETLVLCYLLNKSPRGANHFRQYQDLRRRLGSLLGPNRQGWVARLPSDARLPRAWHELIVLAPSSEGDGASRQGQPEGWAAAIEPLLAETRRLAGDLAGEGAVEVLARPE